LKEENSLGKITKSLLSLVLLMTLSTPNFALAAEAHWVLKELAPFKQLIMPARDTATSGGPITAEEWRSFQEKVLSTPYFDEVITIQNWATMMKLAVRLPKDQLDSLIQGYVYSFDNQGRIKREDAVGGMIKLLTMQTISGSGSQGAGNPSDTITDTKQVSDMQLGLFYKAYQEGLLDATVKDTFRPQEWLTNAEAVSMAYRVMKKYGTPLGYDSLWPEQHWSALEMRKFLSAKATDQTSPAVPTNPTSPANGLYHRLISYLSSAMKLDEPISPEAWHQLLISIAPLPTYITAESARNYTTGLAKGNTVSRSIAVVGLMKLYGPSRDATEDEKAQLATRFSDASDAYDTSKLAICASLNLLQGDEQGAFHPSRSLTVAEAQVLAVRMADYLTKVDK
jgi:hypothetical protein